MDTTGLIVVAAVLVLGTAAGLWRRRTDGRLRAVTTPARAVVGVAGDIGAVGRRSGPVVAGDRGAAAQPDGPAVLGDGGGSGRRDGLAVLGDAGRPGEVRASGSREGDVMAGDGGAAVSQQETVVAGDASAAGVRIDPALLAALGVQPAPTTLLQFSSAFCAPCRALRRVSSEVAALLPGVQHVEVDAESHLDAVRALDIWRTPTLLVLDADGRVVKRATGVPGKPQLIAVLGDVLPAR
jgi:thiol-disulfide isomerase/thioredoxin